jgi:hypothetical protein
VRILGRMLIGLILLGLVLGWILRPRVPRSKLPLLLAAAFVPALLHALFTGWWAVRIGVASAALAGYGVAVVVLLVVGWLWTQRTAPQRPFLAALGVPGHAVVQMVATSLLGRFTLAVGAVLDPLPGVVLLGVATALGAALLVILPTREHLGWNPPRWWTALGRIGRRER